MPKEFLNILLNRSLMGPLDPDITLYISPYDNSDKTDFNVGSSTILAIMFQYIAPNDDDQSLRRQRQLYFLYRAASGVVIDIDHDKINQMSTKY